MVCGRVAAAASGATVRPSCCTLGTEPKSTPYGYTLAGMRCENTRCVQCTGTRCSVGCEMGLPPPKIAAAQRRKRGSTPKLHSLPSWSSQTSAGAAYSACDAPATSACTLSACPSSTLADADGPAAWGLSARCSACQDSHPRLPVVHMAPKRSLGMG